MRILYGSRFFLKLSLICAIAILLTLYPGNVTFEWLGYKGHMPVAVLLAILFAFVSALFFIHYTFRLIVTLPGRTKEYFKKRQLKKFEDVVMEGLTAIAAQQPEDAQACADLARSLAPEHPLSLFLTGQTSFLVKDNALAQSTFRQMQEHNHLKFLGLRGFVMLSYEKKDWQNAQHYLNELFELRPDSPWVLKQLQENTYRLALLDPMQASCDYLPFYKFLSKQEANRHYAYRLWMKAQDLISKGDDPSEILSLAYLKFSEHPIIIKDYVTYLIKNKQESKAKRVLLKAYAKAPHRLLATLWVKLSEVNEPLDVYKSLEKLTSNTLKHPESAWSLAVSAYEAKLWGQARMHLSALNESPMAKSVLALYADIEKAEYPDRIATYEDYKNQESSSAYEYAWQCESCHSLHEDWSVYCPHCGVFASMEWKNSPILMNFQTKVLTHLNQKHPTVFLTGH